MNDGFITLNRKIFSHWVHDNAEYFRAWIDMIAFANYSTKTVLIDGELVECKRGQSVHSVKKWALIFGVNWTEQKVRTFFKLLEKDGIINVEGLRKTTRVTLLKYDTYNRDQRTDNEQITNRQRTDNEQITTTELKELKELKKLKEEVNTLPEKSGVRAKFVIPELSEVVEYCKSRNSKVDADTWHSYYTANGWLVGKNKMRDWKASVRTWEGNNYGKNVSGSIVSQTEQLRRAGQYGGEAPAKFINIEYD